LDFFLLWLLFQAARPLPRPWALAVGRGLGDFVWSVVRFRRAIVLDNIRHAFGEERGEAGVRAIARAFYRNLGMTLLEFLKLPHLKPGEIDSLVDVEGVEHLRAVERAGGGAIFVSGHFGNWEYMGARSATLGIPVSFIVKTQHNAQVDRMQNRIRTGAGIGIIRTGASIKDMIRSLKQGGLIAMLADQDAGKDGVFVEFLGRQASVLKGAGYLSWRLNVPLVTCFIFRQPDGRHLAVVDPPVQPDRNLGQDEAVRRLTEHHVRCLEAAVRRAPDHYYWVHRRWKTRPPEETT
jgi:KDO2-lipid IV(A) lauroyltransferase